MVSVLRVDVGHHRRDPNGIKAHVGDVVELGDDTLE